MRGSRPHRRVLLHVPTQLRCYSRGEGTLHVSGATLLTLDDVLRAVDRRAPGFRSWVVDERGQLRPQMRVFVARAPRGPVGTRDLELPIEDQDEVFLAAAMSVS